MKTYRCAHCGYRSLSARFFRRQPTGRGQAWFCAGCQPPPREAPAGRIGWPRSLTIALVMLPIGLAGAHGDNPMALIPLIYGFFWLAALPSTLLHEAGHATAAALTGGLTYAIFWGDGPLARVVHLGPIRVELNARPFYSMRTQAFWPPERARRTFTALFYLGGALANLLIGAATLGLLVAVASAPQERPIVVCALIGILLQQLWGVSQLWPRHFKRANLDSDGLLLLRLLRAGKTPPSVPSPDNNFARVRIYRLTRANRLAEIKPFLRDILQHQSEDSGHFYGALLHAIAKTEGHRAVVEEVRRSRPELFDQDQSDPTWRLAAVNLAWSALLTEDPNLLPAADRVSEMAWRHDALLPAARMTRGAVLLALGRIAEGAVLMTDALPQVEPLADKAEGVPWLARARTAAGDTEMAAEFEALAVHLAARTRTA